MPTLRFAIVLTFLLVPTLAPTLAPAVESNTQPETAEALEINGYSAITQSVEGLAVHYPAGRWSVETQEIDDQRSLVRLVAKSSSPITLSIFISREMEAPDAHYLNHPNFVNSAVLLPVVLDLAKKDETRIFFSVGTANLPDYWAASTRATVLMEDQHAIHLEACHQLHEESGSMVTALVSTRTKAGQVLEDPDYSDRVSEAYEIIQCLTIGD